MPNGEPVSVGPKGFMVDLHEGMPSDKPVFVESKPYMIVLSRGRDNPVSIKSPIVVKEIRDALKRLGLGPGTYSVILVVE